MKKLTLSLFVIISFAFYAFFVSAKQQNLASNPTQTPVALNINNSRPMMNGSGSTMMSKYRNGSYTGSIVDVYYGNLQVQAIISGGKLADVQFMQYPSDRQTSLRKSQNAMPILKSEAIASQNAQVDAVSGATETSKGFVQSLSNALAQATN